MALGALSHSAAQVALAVTGIAGPDGGTALKPVGTVVVAAVTPNADVVRTFLFPGDRRMVRLQSVNAALNMVRTALA